MNATWWRQQSPIGTLTVLAGTRGLRRIGLGAAAFDIDSLNGDVEAIEGCDDEIAVELDEYFAGRRRRFTIPVDLSPVNTGFPRTVYEVIVTRGVDDAVNFPHGEPVLRWYDPARAPRDKHPFDFANPQA